jgi:hypothetical protein
MYCFTIQNFIRDFREIEQTIAKVGYIDSQFKLTRYQMPDKWGLPVQSFYIAPIVSIYAVIMLILIQIKYRSAKVTS